MGASQSSQIDVEDEEDEESEEDENEEDEEEEHERTQLMRERENLAKKILQQEPEMLPCHASASPLSPQLSSLGTPRLGPSIKVWDPYNVLAPPPPLPCWDLTNNNINNGNYNSLVEVLLINHGDWHMNLRPDLVAGRCPEAALTPTGKRQARALGVFLKSQGVRFNSVYTSPLDRARATAASVCQELNLAEEQIKSSDSLIEISQGHWEGTARSDIYTPETLNLIDKSQPDFSPPSGESLRQVEYRMVQFLNDTLLKMPEKFRSDFSPPSHSDNHEFSRNNLISIPQTPNWDPVQRHQRQGVSKKKSGKSRLQIVTTTTGDHEADDEMSPRKSHNLQNGINSGKNLLPSPSASSSPSVSTSCIGVFTHSTPIKCLLAGVLGCSSAVSHKLCVDDSSVTWLKHSWKTGWQIKKLNDTSHLQLL